MCTGRLIANYMVSLQLILNVDFDTNKWLTHKSQYISVNISGNKILFPLIYRVICLLVSVYLSFVSCGNFEFKIL